MEFAEKRRYEPMIELNYHGLYIYIFLALIIF